MQEKDIINENLQEDDVCQEVAEDEIDIIEEQKDSEEIQILKDSIQRLQADFNNYRRRNEKEKGELSILANEKIILELLPVIDNLERALESCEDKENSLYVGVDMIMKQILDVFTKFNVNEIACDKCEFDPNYHYAVAQEEKEGIDSNTITEVLQKGYTLNEKVIRPAMVKVSK